MARTTSLLSVAAFTVLSACDDIEATTDGLGALYNPCGPDVAPEDCPGGRPATDHGSGYLQNVNGARGEHILDVHSMNCSIRMDTVGTRIDSALCPDCSLTLFLSHASLDDGCGVGPFAYESTLGLVPGDNGGYRIYLSLDGSDWYAAGEGSIQDSVLTYEAESVYDAYYGGYYSDLPAYGFSGTHALTRD